MQKRIFAVMLALMMLASLLQTQSLALGAIDEPVPPAVTVSSASQRAESDAESYRIKVLPDKTLEADTSARQTLGSLETDFIDKSAITSLFTYVKYTDFVNDADENDTIELTLYESELGEMRKETGTSLDRNVTPNIFNSQRPTDPRYTDGYRKYIFSAVVGDCSAAKPGATYTALISYDASYVLANGAGVREGYAEKTTLTLKIPPFDPSDYFTTSTPGHGRLIYGYTERKDIGQVAVYRVDAKRVKDITVSIKYGDLVNKEDSSDKLIYSIYSESLGELATDGRKAITLYNEGGATPDTLHVFVPDWSGAKEGAEYTAQINYSFTLTTRNGRQYADAVTGVTTLSVRKDETSDLMVVPTDRRLSPYDTKKYAFGEVRWLGSADSVKRVTLYAMYGDLKDATGSSGDVPLTLYSDIAGALDKSGEGTGMVMLEDGVYTPHKLLLETPEWKDSLPGKTYETTITYKYNVEYTNGNTMMFAVIDKTSLVAETPEEDKSRTLIYDANGGTGAPDMHSADEGEELYVSDKTPTKAYKLTFVVSGGDAPAERKLDCPFTEWCTTPDGNSYTFKPGDKYDMEGNAILYAQYSDPKAGELPVLTKEGYDFTGWFTAADGGSEVTADTVIKGNTTLYARFEEKKPTSPTDVAPTSPTDVAPTSPTDVTPTSPTDVKPTEPTGVTTPTDAPVKTGPKRLGGPDRYETAAIISSEGWDKADTVVIAAGGNYPDALAGAVLARKLGSPILLSLRGKMSVSAMTEIERLGAKNAIILGGTAAVGETTDKALKDKGINVTRLAGKTRYETAALIANRIAGDSASDPASSSTATDSGSIDTVVLVSSRSYADALSASSAAAINGWPILFLDPNGTVPTETKNAIRKLDPAKAYIIGGTAAVSSKADTSIKGMDISVERVFGADRYATSIKVYDTFRSSFTSDDAGIATGTNFPDALAGSAFAASKGMNVFLVGGSVSGDLSSRVSGCDTIYIFGGTSAVSDKVVEALK